MTTEAKQGVLFVLEAFRRHMDNGRWLFQRGMEEAGYRSAGYGLGARDGMVSNPHLCQINDVSVPRVCKFIDARIVIFWPRYEWDSREWRGTEVKPEHCFQNWEWLLTQPDILRACVLHDAGSTKDQQRRWHEAFDPDVYLSWYHERSVAELMPHVPMEKIVRVPHVVDAFGFTEFDTVRAGCIISGKINKNVYPLRTKAAEAGQRGVLGSGVDVVPHPGYAHNGTESQKFMRRLTRYKVALCTSSRYRFALRKIFEATAAGCIVITDLPKYDCLSAIEENLIRVEPDISMDDLRDVVQYAVESWDERDQYRKAMAARVEYDWRTVGRRLAETLYERHNQKVTG